MRTSTIRKIAKMKDKAKSNSKVVKELKAFGVYQSKIMVFSIIAAMAC